MRISIHDLILLLKTQLSTNMFLVYCSYLIYLKIQQQVCWYELVAPRVELIIKLQGSNYSNYKQRGSRGGITLVAKGIQHDKYNSYCHQTLA